jgi:hypothetical protein
MPTSSTAQPVTATDPVTLAPLAGVSIVPAGGDVVPMTRTTVCTNCGELMAPLDVRRM